MNENPVAPQPVPPVQPIPPVPPIPAQPAASAAPAQPQPVQPAQPVAPARPAPMPARPAAPAQPVAPVQPAETAQFAEPAQPTSAPAGEKPRKKVGIIVAIILAVLALGAGVAAILMFTVFKPVDAVPAAISKLFSGAPKFVSIDGVVNQSYTSDSLPIDSLVVNFKTGINTSNLENYLNGSVSAFFKDENEFQFGVDEVHTSGGDLYLKLSGVADALSSYKPNTNPTNCIDDGSGTTNCTSEQTTTTYEKCDDEGTCETVEVIVSDQNNSLIQSLGVFEAIDNEWIRIPDSNFSSIAATTEINAPTQCLIDAAGNLNKYGSDFTKAYENNQFLTYSTENIPIAKKKSTVYRLGFDNEKLAGFINTMATSGFANELISCMGGQAINRNVTASDLTSITSFIPTIYAEINDNYDFSRVYMTLNYEGVDTTVDLSFDYPASININEPTEYLDYSKVLSELLPKFYGTSITEVETVAQ